MPGASSFGGKVGLGDAKSAKSSSSADTEDTGWLVDKGEGEANCERGVSVLPPMEPFREAGNGVVGGERNADGEIGGARGGGSFPLPPATGCGDNIMLSPGDENAFGSGGARDDCDADAERDGGGFDAVGGDVGASGEKKRSSSPEASEMNEDDGCAFCEGAGPCDAGLDGGLEGARGGGARGGGSFVGSSTFFNWVVVPVSDENRF
jgi:hypothetical protein